MFLLVLPYQWILAVRLMDIKTIELIIETARLGSFNKAAAYLHLSQPNITYAVKSLELELGASIFIRSGSGINLTNFGREFVLHGTALLNHYKQFCDICQEAAKSDKLSLYISTAPFKFVSNVFGEIYLEYAEKNVLFSYLEEKAFQNTFRHLESSVSNIGVIFFSSFQSKRCLRLAMIKQLEYHRLSVETPFIIVGENNPLYSQDITDVDLNDVLDYPYINSYDGIFDDCGERSVIARYLQAQREKNTTISVSNRAMLYDLLHKTTAYTIASNNLNAYDKYPAYDKIKPIPIRNPNFYFEIGWLTRKGHELSPLESQFIDALKNVLKSGDDFPEAV